ncbi:histone deacetylase [Thraustotheca clavata]|uniref:histone deacetylase n=1 Tax=Thraustotheca clavata TaxID=74557 RepID=A0A1V9YYH7_9STRA|nr:histone deacetylase [Thraustotheca clavata]
MPTSDGITVQDQRPTLTSILTHRDHTHEDVQLLKRRVSFSSVIHTSPAQTTLSQDSLEEWLLDSNVVRVQSALDPTLEAEPRVPQLQTTDLHISCLLYDIDAVQELLLKCKIDVNIHSAEGYTALGIVAMATEDKFEDATRLANILLQCGASLTLGDHLGYTPLHWAAAMGNIPMMTAFHSFGVDLDFKSKVNGETALHRAARFGQQESIRFLLSFGASPYLYNAGLALPYDVAGEEDSITINLPTRYAVQCSFTTLQPSFRTLLLHHPDCMEHITIEGHQESPDRITAILRTIEDQASLCHPRVESSSDFNLASFDTILRVHSEKYIDTLKNLHDQVQMQLGLLALTPRIQVQVQGTLLELAKNDAICDTNFSRGTLRAALRAAGSVCHAIDKTVFHEYRNAFCIVRPPGHHAGASGLLRNSVSCGFCILNNVMIGAQYALDTYPTEVSRVAIVDFDAHHGNGTEDILKKRRGRSDSDILFVSMHCYGEGFYPGSGHDHELDTNVFNVALAPCWSTQKEKGVRAFRKQLQKVVIPMLRSFAPNLILISAGFDGCKGDIGNKQHGNRDGPMGLDLRPEEFHWATQQILKVANICCKGRVISVLEGGYGRKEKRGRSTDGPKPLILDTLQESALAHIAALVGDPMDTDIPDDLSSSSSPGSTKRPQRQCSSIYKRSSTDSISLGQPTPTRRRKAVKS